MQSILIQANLRKYYLYQKVPINIGKDGQFSNTLLVSLDLNGQFNWISINSNGHDRLLFIKTISNGIEKQKYHIVIEVEDELS